MRLYRLIAILLLIESRGRVKARELARALETSPRTIYRDIETLCQAGVPITAATGPNGGIRFMQGYSARLYNLQGDDAVNLYLSGSALLNDMSGRTVDLKNALARLERHLPPEFQADIRNARERFYFDEEPWWGEPPPAPCIMELRQAVWGLRKLKISYLKTDGRTSERVVRPYGLIWKAMQWYLAAYCETSGAIRTFKCERILRAVLLDETYTLPVGFNLERHWKEGLESFRAERRAAEKYPVTLRLPAGSRRLLDDLEVYGLSDGGDTVTATVNMHKFEFAKTEVLDIAWHAEIIGPPELREYVAGKITGLLGAYRTGP